MSLYTRLAARVRPLDGSGPQRLFLVCLSSAMALVCQAQEETVDVVAFTPPVAVDLVAPNYPNAEVANGVEGYVDINFMVDTDGTVYETVVSDSSGERRFENAALKAISASKFTPALQDGNPIKGAYTQRYRFSLEGASGGRDKFIREYSRLAEAMPTAEEEQLAELLAALEDVGAINHYERAFLYLARYNYAIRFGGALEQMHFLHGALSFADSEDDVVQLPDSLQTVMWRNLMKLQTGNRHYADALDTYEIMLAREDAEGIAALSAVAEAIGKIKIDDSEFAVPLEIPESGSLWHDLLKSSFYITGGEGDVIEATLYCDTSFSSILLERDINYDLPQVWGDCSVRLVGDSGATFELVQH